MAGRQSFEVRQALEWMKKRSGLTKTAYIKLAAVKFGVNESTLWRAIKANGKRR
jgi:hypothetical protein